MDYEPKKVTLKKSKQCFALVYCLLPSIGPQVLESPINHEEIVLKLVTKAKWALQDISDHLIYYICMGSFHPINCLIPSKALLLFGTKAKT